MDYDILLKNGEVIDPSQDMHTKGDVAIADGKIAAVASALPENRAKTVVDVSGKIVCPGLIDLHTHVYWGVSAYGVDADACCPQSGVTTVVDAGSAGSGTFPGLRRYVVESSQTRIFAFVHICPLGLTERRETTNSIEVEDAARAVQENRACALGVKVRLYKGLSENRSLIEILEDAVRAAELSETPVMVHVSGIDVPLREVVSRLRGGDIVTHCFTARRSGHNILDDHDRVLPEIRDARDRGILFDVGHGSGSFAFDVARAALDDGFPPDAISTDLHMFSIKGPVYDLPTTMSKFLMLGMPLKEVIRLTTLAPARIIGRDDLLGTLKTGAPADIAVLDMQKVSFELQDANGDTRTGNRKLTCARCVRAGKMAYRNHR